MNTEYSNLQLSENTPSDRLSYIQIYCIDIDQLNSIYIYLDIYIHRMNIIYIYRYISESVVILPSNTEKEI